MYGMLSGLCLRIPVPYLTKGNSRSLKLLILSGVNAAWHARREGSIGAIYICDTVSAVRASLEAKKIKIKIKNKNENVPRSTSYCRNR